MTAGTMLLYVWPLPISGRLYFCSCFKILCERDSGPLKDFFLNQFDMYIHHWVVTFVFLIYDCYSMMCQLYICTLLSLSFLVTRPPARGKDLLIPLLKCLVFSVSPSKFLFFQYNISKIIIIHFNIIFNDSPNHIAVANSKQNSQISRGVNLWVNSHSYFYEFKI